MILLRLLAHLDKSLKQKGEVGKKGEVDYWCPVCKLEKHKKKLSINLDKEYDTFGYWHCWNCQISNKMSGRNLFSLYKKIGLDNSILSEMLGKKIIKKKTIFDVKETEDIEVKLPKEFSSLLVEQKSPEYRNAMNYLNKRGITSNDIARYNIGYCSSGEYNNRIIIPSYSNYGQLNYFVSRAYYKTKLKYKNPLIDKNKIIFFDMHINWNYDLILVEGTFDAIEAGSNSIPLLGKAISLELKKRILINKVKNIYIALDGDALKTSIKHIESFMKNDINVYYIDMGKDDPSSLGRHKFKEAKANAVLMDFGNLIKLKLSIGNK